MAEILQADQFPFPAADHAGQNETDRAVNQAVDQLLPADGRSLPSFFVIGPPRTGSSWLHEILKAHTLLPRYSKETRFFDIHFHRGLKWYLGHYEHSIGKRRVGEVAPTYFASALARERMAQIVPNAKIICVFRNPVARILSLYRLKRAYGMIRWSLEEAIERDPELIESSSYAGNLRLWQRTFGAGNVLTCIYDDLLEKPQSFADRLVDFIGVSRFELKASQCKFVHDSRDMTHPRSYYRTRSAMMIAEWFRARRLDRVVLAFNRSPLRKLVLGGGPSFSQIPVEVSRQLHEKFQPEIEQLEVLLDRDLSSWKFQNAK
jgi:hypothetical protein